MERELRLPRVALAASVVSVLLVAIVAATPGSPLQPLLPENAQASGPFRWLADLLGFDALHGSAFAAVGVAAVTFAAVGFVVVLRAAWRGEVSLRIVLALAVAYHIVVLLLPLMFSRDVYSYAYYGRIASTYHANPYVLTPSDFPGDPLSAFVGQKWASTPAVYGPVFTLLSSWITRVVHSVADLIVAFRWLAAIASIGTIAIVARLARRLRPGREAFAVAALGLNPVVLFQSVGSGHNDLLVALAVAGGLALLAARRDLLATAVLTLGVLVKATAVVPLLLLIVVAVVRRGRSERARALCSHVGVVAAIVVAFAAPFFQTKDPSLGMVELAQHEGWLAPSRLVRRLLDGVSGDTLGVVARVTFPVGLGVVLVLLARGLVRRGDPVSVAAQGATWGWGLLFLMLLGPVLLPWYVTWTLPLAWLLPRVPRVTLIGVGLALTLSQFTSEPALFEHAYNANLLFGHYVVTPVVVGLLCWLAFDLRRRVRSGLPLEDETDDIAAASREG